MADALPGLDVSHETLEALRDYEKQLLTWSQSINLISKHTFDQIWNRHIIDSAQLFPLAPAMASQWTDVGSGGGLPGLVIAIIARELNPQMTMTMIESDTRKSAFLKLMVTRYNLGAKVIAKRVETLDIAPADVVSARAFASLDTLIGTVRGLIKPDGLAIFPKGQNYTEEISAARNRWRFKIETKPSIIDNASRILVISRIETRKGGS